MNTTVCSITFRETRYVGAFFIEAQEKKTNVTAQAYYVCEKVNLSNGK